MPLARGCWPTALLLVLLVAPARAVEWTLLLAVPPGSVVEAGVREFAASVSRDSAGALRLRPAEISPEGADAAAMVAAGRAAVAAFPLAVLEADDPALAMNRVPFLATNFVDAGKLWRVLRPRVEQVLSARGMTLLYAVPASPPAPLSLRALTSLDEWRGSRLLVDAPALAPLARFLAASPVTSGSARDALAGELADVAFLGAAAAVRDRAWEYASHYVHAPAWFPAHLVVVSRHALTALGAGTRDIVLDAADAAARVAWPRARAATDEAVQTLRDNGIRAVSAPVDLLVQLEALGRELLFLWSESAGEAGAALVESYYAVR